MPEPRSIKQLIGHDVVVDGHDGVRAQGRLLNASRSSLWLVSGDEDRFIPLMTVSDLRLAS